jgi:hypothetical protein
MTEPFEKIERNGEMYALIRTGCFDGTSNTANQMRYE